MKFCESYEINNNIYQEKKSSFVGHSPVEINASVADGGICFKGGFILLKLAVLNGTNRPINGVTAQIVYTDRYKSNAEVVSVRKAMVTGEKIP